jgi:hypothetical protein
MVETKEMKMKWLIIAPQTAAAAAAETRASSWSGVLADVLDESRLPMCYAVANAPSSCSWGALRTQCHEALYINGRIMQIVIAKMQTNAAVRTMIVAHVCRCRLRC